MEYILEEQFLISNDQLHHTLQFLAFVRSSPDTTEMLEQQDWVLWQPHSHWIVLRCETILGCEYEVDINAAPGTAVYTWDLYKYMYRYNNADLLESAFSINHPACLWHTSSLHHSKSEVLT